MPAHLLVGSTAELRERHEVVAATDNWAAAFSSVPELWC